MARWYYWRAAARWPSDRVFSIAPRKWGQVILRHPDWPAYRCFLPDLAGFTGFCRTGPGPFVLGAIDAHRFSTNGQWRANPSQPAVPTQAEIWRRETPFPIACSWRDRKCPDYVSQAVARQPSHRQAHRTPKTGVVTSIIKSARRAARPRFMGRELCCRWSYWRAPARWGRFAADRR